MYEKGREKTKSEHSPTLVPAVSSLQVIASPIEISSP
jgi:hypothetical protein